MQSVCNVRMCMYDINVHVVCVVVQANVTVTLP